MTFVKLNLFPLSLGCYGRPMSLKQSLHFWRCQNHECPDAKGQSEDATTIDKIDHSHDAPQNRHAVESAREHKNAAKHDEEADASEDQSEYEWHGTRLTLLNAALYRLHKVLGRSLMHRRRRLGNQGVTGLSQVNENPQNTRNDQAHGRQHQQAARAFTIVPFVIPRLAPLQPAAML